MLPGVDVLLLALVVEFSDLDLNCECPDDLARRRSDASGADDRGNRREDSLNPLGAACARRVTTCNYRTPAASTPGRT
jgi:hypothetical protein